ncbi:MAG: hypothetical protein SFY69_03715 [Planctomycetota bacterium]|nr:hypothetical protein [Planctomycetota bacterium]
MPTARVVLIAAVALAAPCACVSRPRAEGAAPAYPREATVTSLADIQVFRRGTRLQFTNTTAQDVGASRLWLNMRYSRPLDPVGVGESVDLDLRDFVDQYGERFRAGGFFSTEPPKPVVLAQLETPAPDGTPALVTLIVLATDADQ